MRAKPKASEETVRKFCETIYPTYTDLALSAGTEETILNDAIELIESLRLEVKAWRAKAMEADDERD